MSFSAHMPLPPGYRLANGRTFDLPHPNSAKAAPPLGLNMDYSAKAMYLFVAYDLLRRSAEGATTEVAHGVLVAVRFHSTDYVIALALELRFPAEILALRWIVEGARITFPLG